MLLLVRVSYKDQCVHAEANQLINTMQDQRQASSSSEKTDSSSFFYCTHHFKATLSSLNSSSGLASSQIKDKRTVGKLEE